MIVVMPFVQLGQDAGDSIVLMRLQSSREISQQLKLLVFSEYSRVKYLLPYLRFDNEELEEPRVNWILLKNVSLDLSR